MVTRVIDSTLQGGKALERHLSTIAAQLGRGAAVNVGFLEDAKYEDGLPVAQVAFWNEFGTETAPPRPFIRTMVDSKSPRWGVALGNELRRTEYDAHAALRGMGETIQTQMVQSIVKMNSPALSPVTLMLRKMKDENPKLKDRGGITGAVVAEAARRVRAGETGATGTRAKPLIDTGRMQREVDFQVIEGNPT